MLISEDSPPRILPPKVAFDRVGVSVRTGQRLVKDGQFVQPVRISSNRIGFLESAVNSWIASRPPAVGALQHAEA